jgi:hypothetical protein
VVNFKPQWQSVSFGNEKILLSLPRIRSYKISRVIQRQNYFARTIATLISKLDSARPHPVSFAKEYGV